jgi:hypothetical protein
MMKLFRYSRQNRPASHPILEAAMLDSNHYWWRMLNP